MTCPLQWTSSVTLKRGWKNSDKIKVSKLDHRESKNIYLKTFFILPGVTLDLEGRMNKVYI